ncbi:MAG: efflux RND transporter periplasmic adaptor subunit [Candidatus Aminicenantes bacterium]|nr:MAG: efflux RND transporter periplasmic adaptor subunit [Candidatus Aminicenantes bacterium]
MKVNKKYLIDLYRKEGKLRLQRLIVFMVIPLLVFLISCKSDVESENTEKIEKIRVRVSSYQKTDYEHTLDFSGEVKAWKTVNMSFNVPGKIDRFYFDEGYGVKKGDLLGKLEQDDYRTVRDQCHAQWEKAERDYERNRRLLEKGSIREQLVQDAHTALKATKAALDAAELNLKHCLLYAPFNGHVAYRLGEEKEMVQAGQTIFTLMDLSRVLIEVGVPEKSIGQIKKGQNTNVTFEAIPGRSFSGKVSQVAVSSLPNVRLFKAEITLQNPDLTIKPGMTATSTIVTEIMKDVYIFSLDVTVLRDSSRIIFLASSGKAKRVDLKDYIITGDKIIVRDSLPEGEQIVTTGQDVLFDSMQISIIE